MGLKLQANVDYSSRLCLKARGVRNGFFNFERFGTVFDKSRTVQFGIRLGSEFLKTAVRFGKHRKYCIKFQKTPYTNTNWCSCNVVIRQIQKHSSVVLVCCQFYAVKIKECPRLYFIVYLSCNKLSNNSARPFCYGTMRLGSENRLDGIQNFGRFGLVFFQTVSDLSDGLPHRPIKNALTFTNKLKLARRNALKAVILDCAQVNRMDSKLDQTLRLLGTLTRDKSSTEAIDGQQ
jgi:hypothetical protein